MRWSEACSEEASKEGWNIFNVWLDNPRIERDDEAGIFAGDQEAWEHIIRKSNDGSALHRSAILFIRENNPEEFFFMLSHVMAIFDHILLEEI